MKVSFGFDGTLSRPDVQAYAKELIEDGVFEVVVTTSRFDDENAYKHNANPTNEDLYAVTDKLGIKRENIHFTNMDDKVNYLQDDIAWHLDDDEHQLYKIYDSDLLVDGIDVNDVDWRWNCSFSMIPDYWKSKYQKKITSSIEL
mgnify:CR=1 FL=1